MDIKKLLKNRMLCRIAACALAFFVFGYGMAHAATLRIDSHSAALSAGNIMPFTVVVNSGGVAINNAEAKIIFPTDLVEIISIGKSDSIFSLWVEEPSFSNVTGTITFNGGVPTPGFTGPNGAVISFVARAKKAGQAEFIFSDAAVRANDGLGTDVLTAKQGKTISVIAREREAEPAERSPALPSPALHISSLTHPNQDQWYKDDNPTFQWAVPTGVEAVQTSIGGNAAGVPRVTYRPAIGEKTVDDLEDGVWYFKVRARRDGAWGTIDTYIVRIDATAPVKRDAAFSYDDDTKVLNISADIQDMASGVDRYDIFINEVLAKSVPAEEFVNGEYALRLDVSGDNAVALTAIDHAGNSVEATGTFYAASVSIPELDPVRPTVPAGERLLLSGNTQNPDTDVAIYVKHGFDEPMTLKTRSNPDKSFFILTPPLAPGDYEIWAETGPQDNKVSSAHIYTEATSQFLIGIGPFTINGFYLMAAILLIMILLVLCAYAVGRHHSRFQQRLKLRTILIKEDNVKALSILKKRLERHLEILQHTRHARVLTKEEKEIKEAIEGDLDEVDKIIEEQKRGRGEQSIPK